MFVLFPFDSVMHAHTMNDSHYRFVLEGREKNNNNVDFFVCFVEQLNLCLLYTALAMVSLFFSRLLFKMCRTMSDCLSESHNQFGVIYICNWQF